MKPTLIKIDRRTVKPNPNAGQTEIHELISKQITLIVEGPHQSLETDKIRLTSRDQFSEGHKIMMSTVYAATDLSEEDLMALRQKFGRRLTWEIQNLYRGINLLHPEPPFLFRYQKTRVRCCHCRKTSLWSNFQDDYNSSYESGEDIRYNVCPHCQGEDCCEIEFENVEKLGPRKTVST